MLLLCHYCDVIHTPFDTKLESRSPPCLIGVLWDLKSIRGSIQDGSVVRVVVSKLLGPGFNTKPQCTVMSCIKLLILHYLLPWVKIESHRSPVTIETRTWLSCSCLLALWQKEKEIEENKIGIICIISYLAEIPEGPNCFTRPDTEGISNTCYVQDESRSGKPNEYNPGKKTHVANVLGSLIAFHPGQTRM